MHRRFLGLWAAMAALAVFAAMPFAANASHAWGSYHWARTANPFTLKLGDNVSGTWDPYLATTSTDWSASTVLDTTIVAGGAGSPKRCSATLGRVEVCNSTYGNNGWLGVAQIWITGGTHIAQGTVKVNDTYFNTSKYNTPAWRNLVMCQEVGHTFGLGHQDENFSNANLGTCMDYTSDPSSNQHPNAHDYEQLETIYAHLDSTTTVSSMPASMKNGDFSAANSWGKLVASSANGQSQVFERDFGGGARLLTHVFWVNPH
ncbi:MAG: hypothetical protein HY875_02210 [Chloroflexi bacterium]|nr:hypothetical protein [Chloroflexota bacterium]